MLDRFALATARPLVVGLMAGVAAYFGWHAREIIDAGGLVGVLFLVGFGLECVLLARRMWRR